MTTPFSFTRKADGGIILPDAGLGTLFDFDFTNMTAMPAELTGGAFMISDGIGYVSVQTAAGVDTALSTSSAQFDFNKYSFVWTKATLRTIGHDAQSVAENSRFSIESVGTGGLRWYNNTNALNSTAGDTEIPVPSFVVPNGRAQYKNIGLLILPDKKVISATVDDRIANAGVFPNMVIPTDSRIHITCRGVSPAVKRLDVMKWSCIVGLK